MDHVPVDVIIEISRFLNQDCQLIFLGSVRKAWRTRSKNMRTKILQLDNGLDAKPIVSDGSIISVLKFVVWGKLHNTFTMTLFTFCLKACTNEKKKYIMHSHGICINH